MQLNDSTAKAHKSVRPGDLVTITTKNGPRKLKVLVTSVRRGPASVARNLYEDLSPPVERKPKPKPHGLREQGSGRPTKRERREIDRWRDRR